MGTEDTIEIKQEESLLPRKRKRDYLQNVATSCKEKSSSDSQITKIIDHIFIENELRFKCKTKDEKLTLLNESAIDYNVVQDYKLRNGLK